jgi:DNA repair ATPase RecN
MQNTKNQITATFKIYDYIVLLQDGFLYQLEHCPKKRTKVFRRLTWNPNRKAYYINGTLVSNKRLKKLIIYNSKS